jgi:hypothetical protein
LLLTTRTSDICLCTMSMPQHACCLSALPQAVPSQLAPADPQRRRTVFASHLLPLPLLLR